MCAVLGDLVPSTGVQMSNFERIGGCAWKLFQLGILVVLLGMAFLFVIKGDSEDVERAVHGKEEIQEQEAAADTGILAKIKRMLGGGDRKKGGAGSDSSDSKDGGSASLKKAQEKDETGNIDLAELLKHADDFNKDTAMLAEGTTEVHQTVLWQIIDGVIYYRIILNPYDRPAHQMMMQPSEALFISFLNEGGQRVAPKAAAMRIGMRKLRVATGEGYAMGWFVDGKIPLEETEDGEDEGDGVVKKSQVGWIFSGKLHHRLQQLQRPKQNPLEGGSN